MAGQVNSSILFHSLFALLLDVVFVLRALTETTQAGPSANA